MKTLREYIKIFWVPVLLAVFLAVQAQAFNSWLHIHPDLYVLRRSMASFGLGVLVFFPALWFTRRARLIYLTCTTVVFALLFFSQYFYYSYSGGFAPFSALFYAGQVSSLGDTLSLLLSWKLLLFLLPVFFVGLLWFKQDDFIFSRRENLVNLVLIAIIAGVSYGGVLVLEKYEWGDTSRLYSKVYDVATAESKLGIANYYLLDAFKFLSRSNKASAQDVELINSWQKNAIGHSPYFGSAKGRNVFVLQIESLENWVIGKKVNGQEVTPFLNSLEGAYFSNYYAQNGQGNTADAEFSTMTSLYPLPETVAFITHSSNNYLGLPKLLSQNGYTTSVMHGDEATFWNRAHMYPALGYTKLYQNTDFIKHRDVGFDGLGDADFFSQVPEKLKEHTSPFMTTLITLTTHTPFELPPDLQTLNIPDDSGYGKLEKNYLQAVRYVDTALQSFFEDIKKAGLYDNSIFIIFGDHGAFIGTHDSADHHVPLFVVAPNLGITGSSTAPTSHIDIYPTITDLLGIESPKATFGRSVFSSDSVVVQRNILTGSVKFIENNLVRFEGSEDGEFNHGKCLKIPSREVLAVENCKAIFDEQNMNIQISDTAVRYNLIDTLEKK